jgi:hypothetical protein
MLSPMTCQDTGSSPQTQRAARSYAALRRAAHYPLSLPPYCKAFMAFLGLHGRSWFDRHCNCSIDSERSRSPKRLPEA